MNKIIMFVMLVTSLNTWATFGRPTVLEVAENAGNFKTLLTWFGASS